MYEVTTPNPNYNGATEGVGFANGKAIVADKHTAELLAHNYGYTIKAVKSTEKGKTPDK